MSLLSICQEVASEIPVAAPTSIVGNPDGTAELMLALAQRAGEALARRPQGGWVALIREYDFSTAAAAQQSGSIANTGPGGTAVVSGLSGISPIAVATWQAFGTGVRLGSVVTAVNPGAGAVTLSQAATQTGAGQFTFGQSDYALPSDFQRLIDNTLWDRSRFWSMRGPQSPQQWQLYKSSVIGRASIQRRFRFRNVGGTNVISIDPVPTDNGSALVLEYVSNAWCKSSGGSVQSAWAADTDAGILDEYLIKLGLRWRVLRRLGMSYSDELDEYERAVAKAVAHDGGAAILDLAPADRLSLLGPWNLPESNFGNVSGT
jgi:hypothetical protein